MEADLRIATREPALILYTSKQDRNLLEHLRH